MSHNISRWITKELTDFMLPWSVITDEETFDIHLKGKSLYVELPVEDYSFEGKLIREDSWLLLSELYIRESGSGAYLDDLLDILSHSTGVLVAILIWECGEYLERIELKDGVLTRTDIEL